MLQQIVDHLSHHFTIFIKYSKYSYNMVVHFRALLLSPNPLTFAPELFYGAPLVPGSKSIILSPFPGSLVLTANLRVPLK